MQQKGRLAVVQLLVQFSSLRTKTKPDFLPGVHSETLSVWLSVKMDAWMDICGTEQLVVKRLVKLLLPWHRGAYIYSHKHKKTALQGGLKQRQQQRYKKFDFERNREQLVCTPDRYKDSLPLKLRPLPQQ